MSRALLSARQREIANLVASGKSNRAIAELLVLSERTVENHVATIFSKLDVNSRVELAAAVFRGEVDGAGASSSKGNLPPQLTSFVGREADVAEIGALFEKARLVTIAGTGGIGKTRAALQVAAALRERFDDGAWFVELAPLAQGELVPGAIAAALGEAGTDRDVAALAAALRRRKLIVVLDNCEHVLADAGRAAAALLRECPGVAVLATSRERLAVPGEYVFKLATLALPDPAARPTPKEALQFGAVALFADRAEAADARFRLDEAAVQPVLRICRRLDGVALALELAAARVKVLSVEQLAQRIDERMSFLQADGRGAPARQLTMRSLIDWSYELLSERERALFARLSIFRGGCTLAAATAVCGEGASEWEMLETLSSLVEKSLLFVDFAGAENRYRLLETTREYARECLAASGAGNEISQRHAEWMIRAFASAEEDADAGAAGRWLTLAPELDNARAALEWSLERGEHAAAGVALALGASNVFFYGNSEEGIRWLRLARTRAGPSAERRTHGDLDWREGTLLINLMRSEEALAVLRDGLAHYRSADDARGAARLLRLEAATLLKLGRLEEGEEIAREATRLARGLNEPRLLGNAIANLAHARHMQGDFPAALTLYREAHEIVRPLADEHLSSSMLGNLASVEFQSGANEDALVHNAEALALLRKLAPAKLHFVAMQLTNRVGMLLSANRTEEARACAREALSLSLEMGDRNQAIGNLDYFAKIAVNLGNDRAAARLLARFMTTHAAGLQVYDEDRRECEALEAQLRERLGPDLTERLMAEGRVLSDEESFEEAMLI